MSSVLPFDIIVLIIDIVGENKDTNLLKELALVSHSFHQICSKHLFATIQLDNPRWPHTTSPKKRFFVKLLNNRPNVAKYIRRLEYSTSRDDDDDHQLSPILLNFLPTFSRLNSLRITSANQDWNKLDSSLTSVFLHLMHLPTINHIDLAYIHNFPLSSLTPSVNLHELDITLLTGFNSLDENYSQMMPKIRAFHTSASTLLTTKLLHVKTQDGRPAFNFMDLRRLFMSITEFEDERNLRYLLQNAKLLEKLHLSVDCRGQSLVGLLSLSASTLKVLVLTLTRYDQSLGGLCKELEAMAGDNMLEFLSFRVQLFGRETGDDIGSIIQNVEKILVKPGWPALREVSFRVSIGWRSSSKEEMAKLSEALQSLPNKYLNRLSKMGSVAVNYSYYIPEW